MSDIKISDVVTVLDLVCAPKFMILNVDNKSAPKISVLKVLQN